MRKAQINIMLTLVSDQAANPAGLAETITVYADSNNIYETICAGFQELFAALRRQGRRLPSFGVSEHGIESITRGQHDR